MTTTFLEGSATRTWGGHRIRSAAPNELLARYRQILDEQRLSWTEHHRLISLLGSGGQGVVYLSERRGTDNFTLPVALKIFSPERYEDERSYDEAMAPHGPGGRPRGPNPAGQPAGRPQLGRPQPHPHDGNGMGRRLRPLPAADAQDARTRCRQRVSNKRWNYVNQVIVTAGPMQPRVKPGIAIAIVRDCLAALAALHREGIVHGDLKPSNIMLKRTGNAKIVDLGSAFDLEQRADAADLHADLRRARGARRRRKHAREATWPAWATC